MYSSVVFSIFTELCHHPQDLILEHFHYPEKKPHIHNSHSLHAPPPSTPRDSMYLPILNILYKGNCTMYGLLCLVSVTSNVFKGLSVL